MRLTACMGACLAAVTFASSASAAPTVATAEASIRNLGFTVTDFRPGDGIAASATWLSGATLENASWSAIDIMGEGASVESATHRVNKDKLFGGTSTSSAVLPTGQAVASKDANGLKAQLTVDRSSYDGPLYLGYRNSYLGPSFDAKTESQAQIFVLNPGTELQLSGQFHLVLDLSTESLKTLSVLPANGPNAALSFSSSVSGYTYITSLDAGIYVPPNTTTSARLDAYQTVASWGVSGGPRTVHKALDQSFSYVLRNEGTTPARFSLNADVSTFVSNMTLTAVPEPATWGLAAAGLLIVAGIGRRQKQQRSPQ